MSGPPTLEEHMLGNPYHEPETALAIWSVLAGARLYKPHAESLERLLPEGYQPPPEANIRLERALEIVLARVRMDKDMARCVMAALNTRRGNRVRQEQYFGGTK